MSKNYDKLNLSHHLSWSSLLQLKGRLITLAVSLTGNIHRSLQGVTAGVKAGLFALDPHIWISRARGGMLFSAEPTFRAHLCQIRPLSYHIAALGVPYARVGAQVGLKAIKSWEDDVLHTVETDRDTFWMITARQSLGRLWRKKKINGMGIVPVKSEGSHISPMTLCSQHGPMEQFPWIPVYWYLWYHAMQFDWIFGQMHQHNNKMVRLVDPAASK